MNNFNRNNNIFNSPWQNPNDIPLNNFFSGQLNGIPPLIQYPNIYQHQLNNFPNHNQNRPDQNRRFKNNFQDFNRNKNRNSFSKNSRWGNNNKNSQNEGTSSDAHEDPDKSGRSELNESFAKSVENKRSEEPKSEESKSSNPEKPQTPIDSHSIEQKAAPESLIDKQRSASIDAICAKSANDVTKKLFNRLRTMDKSNIKDIINNPKLQYETALKVQARQKLNQKMRYQLKLLSEDDNRDGPNLEPDLTVDADKIPMSFIEEIGKAFDLNLLNEESLKENENTPMNVETVNDNDEKAIEVVTNNLGSDDLMYQAERLLMDVNSILDIYDQPEKVEQEVVPEPPVISAITHAGDVQIIDKMAENGSMFRNNNNNINNKNKDPPPIIPFEEKPWEPVMSTKEYEGNLKIIHPTETIPVVENVEPKLIQEKPEVVPKKQEKEEPQDRDSFSNSNSNHSQPQPIHRSVSPTRRRENDISAGNSMSPNDRFRDGRERDVWQRKDRDVERDRDFRRSEQDRSRDRGRERDREKERERDRDRDRPGPRSKQNKRSLNIWENPPEKFRQEPIRPTYPDISHIQPLMSLNPKPPTPTPTPISTPILTPTSTPIAVEPAKLTDDVISNVYRTKLNVEPGQEPDLDSILKPRQFQFKGSFRRGPSSKVKEDQRSRFDLYKGRDRSGSPRRRRSRSRSVSRGRGYHNNYRSSTRRSMEPDTPKLNEKDFNVHLGGLKSHVSALKRMAEIDLEISRTIERLQGIDKVIANMQTERNTAQRAFNKLNMERKHLLESVIKDAQNYVPPAPVVVPPRAVTPETTTTTPAASPEPEFDKSTTNNNNIANNNNNKNSNSSNSSNKLQQHQPQQQQQQQQHIKKPIPVKPPKNIVNVELKKRKLEENIKKEPEDKKRKPETSEVTVSSEQKKSKHGDFERKMKKSHHHDKSGRDLEKERHKRDESEKSKKVRNEEILRKEIKKENDSEKPAKKDESIVVKEESNSSTENKTTTNNTSGIPSTATSSSSASLSSQSVENGAKKHKKKFFDNETDVTDSLARKEKKSKHSGEKPEKKIRKLNEDHLKRALKNAKIQAAKSKQLLFDETSFIKGDHDLKKFKILVNKMVINDDVRAKYKRLGFARMDPSQVTATKVVKNDVIDVAKKEEVEKPAEVEPVAETVSEALETAMEVDMSGPVESPSDSLVINESDPLDFENAQFEILSEVTEEDPIEATEEPKSTEAEGEVVPEQSVEPVAEDAKVV